MQICLRKFDSIVFGLYSLSPYRVEPERYLDESLILEQRKSVSGDFANMGFNPTEQHVSTNMRMMSTWVLILRWAAGDLLGHRYVVIFSFSRKRDNAFPTPHSLGAGRFLFSYRDDKSFLAGLKTSEDSQD